MASATKLAAARARVTAMAATPDCRLVSFIVRVSSTPPPSTIQGQTR